MRRRRAQGFQLTAYADKEVWYRFGPLSPRALDLLIAGTFGLCALAVAVALTNPGLEWQAGAAVAAVLMIAVPVAVGMYAWQRDSTRRFGQLLVLLGLGWFLTTLSNSDSGVLYGIGRTSAWLLEAAVVYVLLAYPSGRLEQARDRVVVRAALAIAVVLYLPTGLLVSDFPTPAPWTTCTDACPANGLMVTGDEPGFIDAWVVPLREALTTVVFVAAAGVLADRVRHATPLTRRLLTPVLWVAIARLLIEAAFVVMRRADLAPDAVRVAAFAVNMTIPLVALGVLVGLLRSRLHSAAALEAINRQMHVLREPAALQEVLAGALGDPSMRLYYRHAASGTAQWSDAAGRPAAPPANANRRFVTEIRDGTGAVAALACDEAMRPQRGLVAAAAECVRAVLERQRLTAALSSSLRDVDASRARIASAADAERRRIERDLHDGAQQRLVALRVRLELAEQEIAADPEHGKELLHRLGPQIDEVIDEVRTLSRGIYPSLLIDAGPVEALRAAALHSPLPVRVSPSGRLARHSTEVESAVYFCCLEALQNAIKHARGASRVDIEILDGAGPLRFEIRDDGDGFDPDRVGSGSGLTNMRDRVAALGGALSISSGAGSGTTVSATVPLERPPAEPLPPA